MSTTHSQDRSAVRGLLNPFILILLASWGGLIFILSKNGVFTPVGGQPPLGIAISVIVPPILFLLAFWRLGIIKRWVLELDLGLVTAVQGWRVVGAAFVFSWGFGMLPATFAIPAGYGDILVGLAAPFVAVMVWQKARGWKAASYGLIIAGFIDFISAITLGVVLRESGSISKAGDIHTGPMAELPLIMIPSFLVPAFMIMHIIAFIKLRQKS